MKCPTCGKELYDNGEDHFNCPFCGAEVVGERFAAEETAEEKFRRLERELARKKVETGVDGQNSAFARLGSPGADIRCPCLTRKQSAMRWSAAT